MDLPEAFDRLQQFGLELRMNKNETYIMGGSKIASFDSEPFILKFEDYFWLQREQQYWIAVLPGLIGVIIRLSESLEIVTEAIINFFHIKRISKERTLDLQEGIMYLQHYGLVTEISSPTDISLFSTSHRGEESVYKFMLRSKELLDGRYKLILRIEDAQWVVYKAAAQLIRLAEFPDFKSAVKGIDDLRHTF